MNKFIKAAVIGHPIAHSKSPLIHTHWIKKYGLNGSYEAIDIMQADLKSETSKLIDQGYAGWNVTVPHKEAMLALCDELDAAAQSIGAVNTVIIKDGKIYGRNTDAFGFITNIKETAPSFDFNTGKAFILGAGGAAKAIIYGLLQQGCPHIYLSNRTSERGEALAAHYPGKITIIPWGENQALEDTNILVNTTILGMNGKPALEFDIAPLNQNALVSDIVYAPLETKLLTAAKSRGNQIVTGIGMLLQQARPAFEAWFGIMPEVIGDKELQEKALS